MKKKKEISTVPKGWTILSHKNYTNKPIPSKTVVEEIILINPYSSYLILENRRKYREELNEMLGDISPYWDMKYAECDDEDDDEMEMGTGYSDDEEYEYVDEW